MAMILTGCSFAWTISLELANDHGRKKMICGGLLFLVKLP